MNGREGFRRVAQAIMGIGWIWAALMCVAALTAFANGRSEIAFLWIISGAIGWGAAKATAWIIRGFASPG
ncbi:hypothetical protein [Burkholderia vietnamiensis]|uniref:hypothetical protein n=1 Tax=Burkholderia vietnamiensis TaxID=60552 RepID=UPI001CF10278|nr:hypothetical protein [Burkholderia vietnamiensis]MCA7984869.1 hypothetical protein [Burkholderia vietnamiensis]HDR9026793.1 hypothetical protein [Burkholderia vietnamiensis]